MKTQNISDSAIAGVASGQQRVLLLGGSQADRRAVAGRILKAMDCVTDGARPLQTPHPSISASGLCGDNVASVASECDLARGGILLLDDLLEFRKPALKKLGKMAAAGALPCLLVAGGDAQGDLQELNATAASLGIQLTLKL